MKFELQPTIDMMLDLYEKPRTNERFQAYLKTLQGEAKGDLAVPISGFNPMAKAHVAEKLQGLKKLGAEQIMAATLQQLNSHWLLKLTGGTYKLALNLADDVMGGWTNRFTSDYDSKFRFGGLMNKGFCTPIFWTSENLTAEDISDRTMAYALRTCYWINKPAPATLQEHVAQEVFAASLQMQQIQISATDLKFLESFYQQHLTSASYHLVFNFFYGDAASQSLAFPAFGIADEATGYSYARSLAEQRTKQFH